MSDAFQELADIPKDFVKDGMLFVNRCTKRMSCLPKLCQVVKTESRLTVRLNYSR